MRQFVFKKQWNPAIISNKNMKLYRTIYKLNEDFLKLVGPEKVDFDRRYMVMPPDKAKRKKVLSETRK